MIISARNQLKGTIEAIQEGAVNAIVSFKADSGDSITSTIITSTISIEAVKELGLAPGKAAIAVIKATEVMIGIGEMKISARNKLAGEIVNIKEGAVNGIVTLKTDGGCTLSSTISMLAVKELGLKPGIKAKAVIKATSVMIAV